MTWPLLLDMAQGKYLHLGKRPVNEYDWWTLWLLAHGAVYEGTGGADGGNKVNLTIAQTAPNEACTGIDDTPLT